MRLLETERLSLRWLTPADAPFILELVNDPDWLRNIGDRGVRDLDDAAKYLMDGPMSMYERHGHGLNAVELKASGEPIGICGVLRRDWLDDPDIGFALLPAFRGRGYAREAAFAVVEHARSVLGMRRLAAVVSPGNKASMRLLTRLGMRFDRTVHDPDSAQPLDLYLSDTPQGPASDSQ